MEIKCDTCAKKCTAYEGIKAQKKLKLVYCDKYTTKVNKISCHWCSNAVLYESSHEWISCRCSATGKDIHALYPDSCKDFKPIEGVFYESDK